MPVATAALFDDGWWNVIGGAPIGAPDPGLLGTPRGVGEVTAAAVGDVDGDGTEEAVVAFLRPYRPTLVNQRLSDGEWTDAEGRTAHLGVYDRATLRQRWVAGTLARPVVALAVCDGGVAVGYGSFDGPGVVAAGAWRWRDFGFVVSEDLDGPALVGCVDVDGDRSSDPVVQPHDRGDVRPSPDPAG